MSWRHLLSAFPRSKNQQRAVSGRRHRPRRPSELGWLNRLFCLLAVACVAAAGELGTMFTRWISPVNSTPAPDLPSSDGALLIHGGGRVPDSVRRRFCELAGGSKARVVVIPARYVPPDDEAYPRYLAPWKRFVVQSVEILSAPECERADEPDFTRSLEVATGVWLGGGDQSNLAAIYAGTEVERQLKKLIERGGVVGGSSAGAAAMSKVMISEGRRSAIEGGGFDLLPGAVIDQHFLKRNRFQRLSGVLSAHPELLGFGIDERTALVVKLPAGRISVIGESYVVACVPGRDGQSARTEILKPGDRTSFEALHTWESPVWAQAADVDELFAGQ
jgi:cyanophycinase